MLFAIIVTVVSSRLSVGSDTCESVDGSFHVMPTVLSAVRFKVAEMKPVRSDDIAVIDRSIDRSRT